MNVWERKVLCRIYGPIKEVVIWQIRKNAELRTLFGEPEVSFIKKGCLRWLRHVARMLEDRVPRKLLYGELGGRR